MFSGIIDSIVLVEDALIGVRWYLIAAFNLQSVYFNEEVPVIRMANDKNDRFNTLLILSNILRGQP